MFEGIHFDVTDSREVYFSNTGDLQNAVSSAKGKIFSGDTFESYYSIYEDISFRLDGLHKTITHFPCSDYALDHLLYLQSFSLTEAGPMFFTDRKKAFSYQLIYTYSGGGEFEYQGKKYILGPGDGLLVDCKQRCVYRTAEQHWNHAVLHFYGGDSDYLYSLYSAGGDLLFHQPLNGTFQELLEKTLRYYTGKSEYRDMDFSNSLENLIVHLIHSSNEYRNADSHIPQSISSLLNYISMRYMNELDLRKLSDVSGYNSSYLCRTFKKYVGVSPNSYILNLRLSRAKELLRDTDLNAQTIGAMVGIHDENYFYRLFKSRVGMTPTVYRKQMRGAEK